MSTSERSKSQLPKLAFNRAEAAETLGVSVKTVDRLARKGKLKPNRTTRRPLYPRSELERFLALSTS